jgi:hypothetical protein
MNIICRLHDSTEEAFNSVFCMTSSENCRETNPLNVLTNLFFIFIATFVISLVIKQTCKSFNWNRINLNKLQNSNDQEKLTPVPFTIPKGMDQVSDIFRQFLNMRHALKRKYYSDSLEIFFRTQINNKLSQEKNKILLETIRSSWGQLFVSNINLQGFLGTKAWQVINKKINRLKKEQVSFETIESQLDTSFKTIINKTVARFHMHVVDMDFRISPDVLKKYRVSEESYQERLKQGFHDCFDYCFNHFSQPEVIKAILFKDSSLRSVTNHDRMSVEILNKWGYVEVDEGQPGDLIVYIDQKKTILHVGILETAQRVISKWGHFPVLSHPINAVPPRYGKSYLRFRMMN